MERNGPPENAGVPASGGPAGGRHMGRCVAAAAGRAGAGAGGGVRRRAVAGHGVHAPGRIHGRVRRGAVPAGPAHPPAHSEGLPLRGLRRDLPGAAGPGPVEPVPVGGEHCLAGAAADPGGSAGLRRAGGAGPAAHGHQSIRRHGRVPGRLSGGSCGAAGAVGGTAPVAVGQLRPPGGGSGLWPGGVVRLPESGRHVRGYLRLCPDARRAVRLRGSHSVEGTAWI